MKSKLKKAKAKQKTPKQRKVRKALGGIETMLFTYSQDCTSYYFIFLLIHAFLISVVTKISKTDGALVSVKRKVYSVAKRHEG